MLAWRATGTPGQHTLVPHGSIRSLGLAAAHVPAPASRPEGERGDHRQQQKIIDRERAFISGDLAETRP
jgi:hypothetical protein